MELVGKNIGKVENRSTSYQIMLVAAVLLIAFNLRPAITSIGPLIGTIRDDVGFANWNIALLTSLPLIAFMLISPIAPKLANRLTSERTLMLGLCVLIIGISLRSISMVVFLFLGTFLIGFGIAICNVLLPSVIKDKFPHKVAIMTSLYTTSMTLFATIASGVSIPLADGLQLGWQLSLLVWIIPALIGLIIWVIIVIKNKQVKSTEQMYFESKNSSGIWKVPLAWQVALFMGLQSLIFYTMISWLPEILIFYGMNKASAGFMLSYFQFIGIPISFFIPMVATKLKTQRPIVLTANLLFIVGLILLLTTQAFPVILLATTLLGIASSSNFALALTFLSIRAKHAKDAAEIGRASC